MKTYLSTTIFSLSMLVAFLMPFTAHAQLREVEQTVFGMDCAPCAYGLEQRMQAFEGVEAVSVSLNDGLVALTLQPENDVTLQEIREAIRESGFSAETATITVSGTLAKEDGQWILSSSSGARYLLEQASKNISQQVSTREQVTVTGTVPEGEKPAGGWTLKVTALDRA